MVCFLPRSNPDLVERLRSGTPLNIYDRRTFYSRPPVAGYIDYPAMDRSVTPLARDDYEVMKQEDIGVTLESVAVKKSAL